MTVSRKCSKTACRGAAVATLTYVYSDRAVVLGPLATYAEPHTYDLCADHASRLTAPRGWDVVRLVSDLPQASTTTAGDDLLALADAVREARGAARVPGRSTAHPAALMTNGAPAQVDPEFTGVRRGHLRVLRGEGQG